MTALEIAAAVRSGQQSARSVIDEYLGKIVEGDADVVCLQPGHRGAGPGSG